MNERKKTAKFIARNSFLYKICEGCDSIVSRKTIICPNCKSYRFNLDEEVIKTHAKILGSREQETVTPEDLF